MPSAFRDSKKFQKKPKQFCEGSPCSAMPDGAAWIGVWLDKSASQSVRWRIRRSLRSRQRWNGTQMISRSKTIAVAI